ncbi:MAG: metallophosphoesterase, partial [Desulfobacterales bacterium]
MGIVRILLFGDTHLGFDFPFKPRIKRPRRGHDFFANMDRVMAAAIKHRVDGVVHTGDLFYRSKVPQQLVDKVFEPIHRIADKGIPVYIVPGNHERSAIPYSGFSRHPRVHVFDRPRTFTLVANGRTLALSGFPYEPKRIRDRFPEILAATGWRQTLSDYRVLCMHHCVEGATVGVHNYTFRYAPDVVRIADIPHCYAAVVTGHIHRFQVLTGDLRDKSIPTPILYPGSTERTSFAEKNEKKGYIILDITEGASPGGCLGQWTFHPLPARPMIQLDMSVARMSGSEIEAWVAATLREYPESSIVKISVHGTIRKGQEKIFSAPILRSLAP